MVVSLKETSICVVDGSGRVLCEGTVLSEPSAIADPTRFRRSGSVGACVGLASYRHGTSEVRAAR